MRRFSVLPGQVASPSRYDPLVDKINPEILKRWLLQRAIRRLAEAMSVHAN
jgi:hypothetical protein